MNSMYFKERLIISNDKGNNIIFNCFSVDTESPSGLTWKRALSQRVKIGACAGTLGKDQGGIPLY
ncbi:hypothetical protein DMB83_003790, partial [Pectobacterium aquaticum]